MATQLIHVFENHANLVVERARTLGDLLCVGVLFLVAPDVVDDPERHHQRRRTHDHQTLLERLREDLRIAFHREREGRLDRNEHQDEVERADAVELIVALCG